jgi:hypothetical protein
MVIAAQVVDRARQTTLQASIDIDAVNQNHDLTDTARARQTADIAIRTIRKVQQDGSYDVWWDTSLLPHQKFREEIDVQLDACKAAIIIWTPHSIKSDWVLAEAEHARRQQKLISTHVPGINPNEAPPQTDEAWERADRLAYSSSA